VQKRRDGEKGGGEAETVAGRRSAGEEGGKGRREEGRSPTHLFSEYVFLKDLKKMNKTRKIWFIPKTQTPLQ
jgi:hypothetical protein